MTDFSYTVKLVYKDHPKDQQNVVLIYRWSLYAGSIAWKLYTWGTVKGGLYKQVVFLFRWSLEQVFHEQICCCAHVVQDMLDVEYMNKCFIFCLMFYSCLIYILMYSNIVTLKYQKQIHPGISGHVILYQLQ